MAEVSYKKVEEAPVKQVQVNKKMDRVLQKKLLGLLSIFAMFVVSFFALKSGNETFMWVSLGLMLVSGGYLYAKN